MLAMHTSIMDKDNKNKVKFFTSVRFAMLMLWFFGSIFFYMIRVNLGVSIVCMTRDPVRNVSTLQNYTTFSGKWSTINGTYSDWPDSNVSLSLAGQSANGDITTGRCEQIQRQHNQEGDFEWDRKTRGLLSSAFYWGYLITQIPGGYLTQMFGAKAVHFGGLAIGTVASLLSPVCATFSPWALFTARFILGLGCGVFVPATTALVSNWSPTYERTIIYTIQASGYSVGTVVAFSVSGALCDSIGWPSTFYVPSALMCVYLIIFLILGANSPKNYRCISKKEEAFIVENRGQEMGFKDVIPWKHIFSSVPCWAMFLSEFFSSWGGYMTITSGAQYMKDVLKLDIKANGFYSSLPQLCRFILSLVAGVLIDTIRRKHILNTTNARKLAETLGMLIPAIVTLGLGFIGCELRVMSIVLLCVAQGFDGFGRAGISVNIMEVAPRYVAILVGILNSFSTAAGMISPIVVGLLTTNGYTKEWQIVFFMGSAIYALGWLIFVVFTSAEEQHWAKNPPNCADSEHAVATPLSEKPGEEETVM